MTRRRCAFVGSVATVVVCIAAGGVVSATVVGTPRNDTLRGSPVADILDGRAGADRLFGLAGNDLLKGGIGHDRLVGGSGLDRLECGAGKDTAVTDRRDTLVACERVEISKAVDPLLRPSLVATAEPLRFAECPEDCFSYELAGDGFHPESNISLTFVYSAPCCPTYEIETDVHSDKAGAFDTDGSETCGFDELGVHHGDVAVLITARDAEGAAASALVSGGAATCP